MNQRGNDPEDLTNSVIGGYRVLHRLGRGGMSEVYLAFHENLRRHVALKVLRQDLVGSADHQTRFLQEARAAASLVHTNIVQVYDIGQFQNVHYIAQEYIRGITYEPTSSDAAVCPSPNPSPSFCKRRRLCRKRHRLESFTATSSPRTFC